jgi:hypothetical protein
LIHGYFLNPLTLYVSLYLKYLLNFEVLIFIDIIVIIPLIASHNDLFNTPHWQHRRDVVVVGINSSSLN